MEMEALQPVESRRGAKQNAVHEVSGLELAPTGIAQEQRALDREGKLQGL